MSNTDAKTSRKLVRSIGTVVVLALCFVMITFALSYSTVTVEDNQFEAGTIELNLNDEKPIIETEEFLFEPGMTVKKDFFIENKGSGAMYYRLYFAEVAGDLADVLEIRIEDEDAAVLYEGKVSEMTQENVNAADDILGANERKNLSMYFHFPEKSGNDTQNGYLEFELKADGVQTKNNSNKQFN